MKKWTRQAERRLALQLVRTAKKERLCRLHVVREYAYRRRRNTTIKVVFQILSNKDLGYRCHVVRRTNGEPNMFSVGLYPSKQPDWKMRAP